MTSFNSEPDVDDVPDLELTPALVEPEVSNATLRSDSESTGMLMVVRRSSREIRAPQRLIDELQGLSFYRLLDS